MFVYLRPILNDRDKEGIGKWRISVKLFEILGASKNGNNAIGGFIQGFIIRLYSVL